MPAVSGSPTQLAASVTTLANLGGLPDDAYKDGDFAYVQSSRATYQLDRTSNATPSSVAVDTFSGNGQWVFFQASTSWQTQATWYIDPATGDDENEGSTTGTALATWREFTRRVSLINIAMTVTILSNIAEALIGQFSSSSASASLTIAGLPTVLASGGGAGHSTMSDPVPATNSRGLVSVDNLTTSAGAAAVLSDYVGKMLRCPATDANGEFLAPALRASGNDVNVPWWARVNLDNTKPVNGAIVEVLELITCPTAQIFALGVPTQIRYMSTTATDSASVPIIVHGLAIDCLSTSPAVFGSWFGCRFGSLLASSPGSRSYAFACLFAAATTIIYPMGGRLALIGGGSTTPMQHTTIGTVAFQGFVFDGGKLQVGSSAIQTPAVTAESTSSSLPLGVFGSTGDGVAVSGGAQLRASTLFGTGNAGYGVSVATGGGAFFQNTPTITGANDLAINAAVSAVPPPSALGVWSAAADLSGANGVGWAKWVAAPFSRNVMSYANGSKICGS